MKKIGLFGGSFDPIHNGHLNLALTLLEKHALDQILFCPAAISPLKDAAPPHVAKEHRRAMVELAIKPIPSFQLLDWELNQTGPSYTIDTVKAFLKQSGSVHLHLILGEDSLQTFHLWRDYAELIALATPLIGSRLSDAAFSMPELPPSAAEILREGISRIPVMEISSTTIRERLSQKKTCCHLLPALVLDYIERNHLYS